MADEKIEITEEFAFELLDLLSTNYIYVLLGSEFEEELGEDFKPHKWQGHEKEHAEQSVAAYRKLMRTMEPQIKENHPE